MAEKNSVPNADDSGMVSESLVSSANSSPGIERNDSRHSIRSFNKLSENVVVYKEPDVNDQDHVEPGQANGEEANVLPVSETQEPSPPRPTLDLAHFTIGGPVEEEDKHGEDQSASSLLQQEAQKQLAREKREQESKLAASEAKLVETEDQLGQTKEKLAVAEARNIEVEQQLSDMTKKKEEAEQKLKDVEQQRDVELKQLQDELTTYKTRLAEVEKKNDDQRAEYEAKIKLLEEEMEEKKKTYDTSVLALTEENCFLRIQVADMKAEEQSLKRQIAELQRDLERQEKESLKRELEAFKSDSAKALAEKDASIQTLERLLSENSMHSNSSIDNNQSDTN